HDAILVHFAARQSDDLEDDFVNIQPRSPRRRLLDEGASERSVTYAVGAMTPWLLRGGERLDVESPGANQALGRSEHRRVVVDHENGGFRLAHAGADAAAAGRRKEKVAPGP